MPHVARWHAAVQCRHECTLSIQDSSGGVGMGAQVIALAIDLAVGVAVGVAVGAAVGRADGANVGMHSN